MLRAWPARGHQLLASGMPRGGRRPRHGGWRSL